MSLQDIKDRIPTNVLSNGAIRYGVYDEAGGLLRYEYMKREDEPTEEGTNINRALLRNLQGDLYTQDRYSEVSLRKEIEGDNYVYYADLNLPLTSYEKGKIINIIGGRLLDDTQEPPIYINSFSNVYLNINNLGAKKISKGIEYGVRYSLIYNGENWDILYKSKVLNWTIGERVTEFKIEAINKTILEGESFDIYITGGADSNARIGVYINEVLVRTGYERSGYPLLIKCTRIGDELVCICFYNNNIDTYTTISFNGTINSIKQSSTSTYTLLENNTVNLVLGGD